MAQPYFLSISVRSSPGYHLQWKVPWFTLTSSVSIFCFVFQHIYSPTKQTFVLLLLSVLACKFCWGRNFCLFYSLLPSKSLLEWTELVSRLHDNQAGDAIQPSHPLPSPSSPAPIFPSIRVFCNIIVGKVKILPPWKNSPLSLKTFSSKGNLHLKCLMPI